LRLAGRCRLFNGGGFWLWFGGGFEGLGLEAQAEADMRVVKRRQCGERHHELCGQAAEAQADGKAGLGAIDLEVPEAVLQDDGDLGGVARLEMGGDGDAGMVGAEWSKALPMHQGRPCFFISFCKSRRVMSKPTA